MAEKHSSLRGSDTGTTAGWFPFLVGAVLCSLVLVMWRTLKMEEHANLRGKVQAEAEFMADQIGADLRNRLPALRRMARRWGLYKNLGKEDFIGDARVFLADTPGFQALAWADAQGVERWVEPLRGNEKALDLKLDFEANRRTAMDEARTTKTSAMTLPVDLVQGGKGFLTLFPIYSGDELRGYVLATFRIQEWLDFVFTGKHRLASSDGCKVAVFFDKQPVYEQAGWAGLSGHGLSASAVAEIMNHRLIIRVRPTDGFVEGGQTHVPTLTLVFGLLLSLLVAVIVALYQRTYSATWKANLAEAAREAETGERKKAERELQRVVARLDLANKAGHMGIWSWDIASGRLTWNDRMFELYKTPTDVSPAYEIWRDAVHPDDRQRCEELLKAAIEGKAAFDTEFRLLLPDASVRHIKAAASVERDPTGKALHVTGMNWDITEQRQNELSLRKSEECVRLLLNSTGEAIYGLDLEGRCTFANPACAKLLGYPDPQSLLGKNMHTLIHYAYPGGKPMAVEDCRVYKAFHLGRGEHVVDEVLWRIDGSSFPAEYWSFPQIEDGQITGAVVTFVDITERRKAEEERESLIANLEKAIMDVRKLSGLLPICASCKKIRDDKGYWNQLETYIRNHSEAEFSHGLCPDCAKKLYPDIFDDNGKKLPPQVDAPSLIAEN